MKTVLPFLAKASLLIFLIGSISSCEKEDLTSESVDTLNASVKAMNTVRITSDGMNFDAPDEILSGWNTFKYTNATSAPHFFILVKIPEDKTLEMYRDEVTVPFNNLLKLLRGETPEGSADIAGWFFSDAFNYGGSGLIDPGKTAVTSINLKPGNYIIECYVKMPNGDFHSVHGMLDQITVTEEKAKDKEPKADVNIAVAADGYVLDSEIRRPGLHTFKVEFDGGGNTADVHLVRIDDATEEDIQNLNSWMFWGNNLGLENEGLMTPAPAGLIFLGGTQELALGGTTYFQAVLEPGTYALISEVADPIAGGYYHEFSVGGKIK